MPQRKKDSSVRSRRNKAASRATLRRVDQDTTTVSAYEQMTVAQLKAAIDRINEARPVDAQLPKRGAKAVLVELLAAADRNIPALPDHPPTYDDEGYAYQVLWHDQTISWWNDVWTSPMAQEWDESDLHNVFVLALLYNDIWRATTARERKDALAEFRLQRVDLGLSPYSRRRLEWTIETAEEAKDRGEQRRRTTRKPVEKPAAGTADPRAHLTAVK